MLKPFLHPNVVDRHKGPAPKEPGCVKLIVYCLVGTPSNDIWTLAQKMMSIHFSETVFVL